MLTITLAAVLGLLGVVAVVAYAHQANQRAVAGLKAETVLVAKFAIPAGTSLDKAQNGHLLGTEKMPVSSFSKSAPAVQKVTATNGGQVVSATVAPGQVLLTNMLTSANNATAAGSFLIPPGMIAVTVYMCISEAVADYVTPGSDVAVFNTLVSATGVQRTCETQHQNLSARQIISKITNRGGSATLLVLQKAEVLAVGQNPAAHSAPGGSSATATADPSSTSSPAGSVLVTLAVNQDDAERLILIDEVGLPYMALLGPSSHTAFAAPVSLFQPPQQQQP